MEGVSFKIQFEVQACNPKFSRFLNGDTQRAVLSSPQVDRNHQLNVPRQEPALPCDKVVDQIMQDLHFLFSTSI